ncbi:MULTISPECIES: helix-turn-helix domain-containing protein [Buttiauxella]|jgi:HTH-type transcriptional regulator/antitoxin HigA|uniref:helix-turn-helix domain-containing protein n=1 Tax=Buttiauxella TaxID=82976 RepID=UPI001064B9B3|nr:helix-turn-helix domain-containing protein [Buttiauxella sp. BIGb0552]TDX15878.1 HTH-type transcriptional regulator/antitoxin HigA [Buttiauxella sp. BIGb0552]
MIADALKAAEALKIAVPFLAGNTGEKEYLAALELVEYLLVNEPTNPLLDLVSLKISEYENQLPEVIAFREQMNVLPSGIAVLKTLMDQYQLNQSDFQQEIGSKSMVSRVLSGERQLTIEHIRKLSLRFGISPALFI